MEVHDGDFLVDVQRTSVDPADPDPSDIIVVVDGGYQHLQFARLVAFRRRDVTEDLFEQRNEIRARLVRFLGAGPGPSRAVQHRAVQLFVVGAEVHQKLEDLVLHLTQSGIRSVDLVDTYDHAVVQRQRALQDEPRLGHRAFRCVHQQDDPVDHFQDPLDLAAEIGMPGGVYDIDLYVFVMDGRVLGQDRDAAFPLDLARVHDTVDCFLVLPKNAALAQQLVDQRRFSVVDVCDDGDIPQIVPNQCFSFKPAEPVFSAKLLIIKYHLIIIS